MLLVHPSLILLQPSMHSFALQILVTGQVLLAVKALAGSLAFRHRRIDTGASSTEAVAAVSFASVNVGSCWGSYHGAAKIRCCWARRDAGLRHSRHQFVLVYSWLADWGRFHGDSGYPLSPLNH